MSTFPGSTFRWFRFDAFSAPRRPRHPLLRALAGLAGIAVLLVLLIFGVIVGAAMLGVGALWQAWTRRRAAQTHVANVSVIDASFRVVEEPRLPLPR